MRRGSCGGLSPRMLATHYERKANISSALGKHAGIALDKYAANLVYNELVSNVLKHAREGIRIRLERKGEDILLKSPTMARVSTCPNARDSPSQRRRSRTLSGRPLHPRVADRRRRSWNDGDGGAAPRSRL